MRGVVGLVERGESCSLELFLALPYVLSDVGKKQFDAWHQMAGVTSRTDKPLYNVMPRTRAKHWVGSLIEYCGPSAYPEAPPHFGGLHFEPHEFGGSFRIRVGARDFVAVPVPDPVARRLARPECRLAFMRAIGLRSADNRQPPTPSEIELILFAVEGFRAGFRAASHDQYFLDSAVPLMDCMRKEKNWISSKSFRPWLDHGRCPDGQTLLAEGPLRIPWLSRAEQIMPVWNDELPARFNFELSVRAEPSMPRRARGDKVKLPLKRRCQKATKSVIWEILGTILG